MKIALTKIQTPNAGGKMVGLRMDEAETSDVSSIELSETEIIFHHNNGEAEVCPLRSNDGKGDDDWFSLTLYIRREPLKVNI